MLAPSTFSPSLSKTPFRGRQDVGGVFSQRQVHFLGFDNQFCLDSYIRCCSGDGILLRLDRCPNKDAYVDGHPMHRLVSGVHGIVEGERTAQQFRTASESRVADTFASRVPVSFCRRKG